MFRIREEHLKAMQPLADLALRRRVLEYVLEHCAVSHLAYQVIDRRVQFGIQRAKTYHLVTEQGVTTFVSLMFNIAPNFDSQLEIQEILRDNSLSESTRTQRLVLNVPPQTWAAAELGGQDLMWPDIAEKKT